MSSHHSFEQEQAKQSEHVSRCLLPSSHSRPPGCCVEQKTASVLPATTMQPCTTPPIIFLCLGPCAALRVEQPCRALVIFSASPDGATMAHGIARVPGLHGNHISFSAKDLSQLALQTRLEEETGSSHVHPRIMWLQDPRFDTFWGKALQRWTLLVPPSGTIHLRDTFRHPHRYDCAHFCKTRHQLAGHAEQHQAGPAWDKGSSSAYTSKPTTQQTCVTE